MRETRNAQASIFEHYSNHEYGVRLQKLSEVLDRHPEILNLVAADLIDTGVSDIQRKKSDQGRTLSRLAEDRTAGIEAGGSRTTAGHRRFRILPEMAGLSGPLQRSDLAGDRADRTPCYPWRVGSLLGQDRQPV